MKMNFSTLPPTALLKPTPFQVTVAEQKLQDMLQLVRLSPVAPPTYESSHADRKWGISREWLEMAKHTWLTNFDWRKHEAFINSFPNYTMPITEEGDEFSVHFVALFSRKKDAVPLMMIHGWPGNFLEFLPILSRLREAYTPETLPFHVVVPSIPGYAFSSGPPVDRDFTTLGVARLFDRLMKNLGFESGYAVQGGDIGSRISRIMAVAFDSCKAIHEGHSMDSPDLTAMEQKGLARARRFLEIGRGYAIEHATKTSTIGMVLSSSPLALLAWIGEKFLDWTDHDPPMDTILESVTLYWLTDTIARCIYPYRERLSSSRAGEHDHPDWKITGKPFGFSSFPKELGVLPKSWIATTGDLIFYRAHEKGGHFAAMEQPDVLLQDVKDFLDEVWKGASHP